MLGKLALYLLKASWIARAIEILGFDLLRLGRVEEIEEGFRDLAGTVLVGILVNQRHGRLRQDGTAGIDDLVLAGRLLLRQMRFIFPGQQHIADAALGEGDGRAAGAGIQHRHMLVKLGDEILGLGRIAAGALFAIGPGRQIGPAGATRCFGIGRVHLDSRFQKVAPILDLPRIALAHDENDRGRVGRGRSAATASASRPATAWRSWPRRRCRPPEPR